MITTRNRKEVIIMRPETLRLLKRVVCLLENGVKPCQLKWVLRQFGTEENAKHNVNWQFEYFISRLDLFWDEDFSEKDLAVCWTTFDKPVKKKKGK
jgi:hypothetical protein